MAENDKDIPVKEQEDGSALVSMEHEKDPFPEEDKETKKAQNILFINGEFTTFE